MILSRVKPAVGGETAVIITEKNRKNKRKVPSLQEYLQQRDYLGALTLLEFQRSIGEKEEHADLWIGYSAFHLGDHKRAMEEYKSLTMKRRCGSIWPGRCFFWGSIKKLRKLHPKILVLYGINL